MRSFSPLTINHTADGTIEPYRIVKPGTLDGEVAQAAAASDKAIGVSGPLGVTDGKRIDCHHGGVVPVEYGGTIAAGDLIAHDADGRAVVAGTAGAGARPIGIAFVAGAVDEIGEALLFAPAGGANVEAGNYVPTLTGVANVDTATLVAARYTRIGSIVRVDVEASIDPTAAAATQVRISLPVASVLAAAADVGGLATIEGGAIAGSVKGDVVNAEALLDFTATGTAAQTWRASFSYEVLAA